eukprot:TRINITY_DN12709_c0_g1_i1.p1 TRINITY_DN12709_c0_g1~~TRINITY_DN12709_c0_g1_i1.p1  ORF type:complete len:287 (-),score=39.50 TRINITY_DN12709_c0_g1_i1:24-851(-)
MKYLVVLPEGVPAEPVMQMMRQIAHQNDQLFVLETGATCPDAGLAASAAVEELRLICPQTRGHLHPNRNVCNAVVEHLSEQDCNVAVVASPSRGTLHRIFSTCVGEELLHAMPSGRAVMLIHEPVLLAGTKRYLLCVHNKDRAERAAAIVAQMLQPQDRVLFFCAYRRVFQNENRHYEEELKTEVKAAQLRVQDAVRAFQAAGGNPHSTDIHVEAADDPKDLAVDLLNRADIGIVVCGSGAPTPETPAATGKVSVGKFTAHILAHTPHHCVLVVY